MSTPTTYASRSPQSARRSRPKGGYLAAGLVVAVGAVLGGCGDDTDPGRSPGEAFYDGLSDELNDQGLSDGLAACFVDAVRSLEPTNADVSFFEENGDFPDAMADELDTLTTACLAGDTSLGGEDGGS